MAGLGHFVASNSQWPEVCNAAAGILTRHIAAELKAAGVIRSANAFVLWHYAHHQRSLKAGEYLFDKSADARIVHDRLARGDIYVHTVVIPEGFNMFDVAQAIQDAGLGPKEEFLKVAQAHTALIADFVPEAKSLEGYLFPSTYQFTRTQNMPEMAAIMVKQFRQVAQEIGLTANVQKTVTMASIVEKKPPFRKNGQQWPAYITTGWPRISRCRPTPA